MAISDSTRLTGQALLDQLDKLQCHNHILMAQSTGHYVRRLSNNTKRKLYIYFYLILNITYGLKYAILSFTDKDCILALLGENIYELENNKLKSRIIFILFLGISIFIIVVHYLESTHQLVHLGYIFNNISGRKNFVLSSNYQDIFVKRNLKYCCLLNNLHKFIKFFVINIFTLLAYFTSSMKQNILLLLFFNNFVMTILSIYGFTVLFTMFIWSYMTLMYIQLKFTSIIDMISSNLLLVKRAILDYNRTYRIVNKLEKSFNILLSIIYIYYPTFYIFLLNSIVDGSIEKTIKFSLLLTLFFNVIINYIIFNKMTAISTTNTSILYNLYPILVDKNFKKLKLRLRIDSFIARLNTEFIGFHCWLFIKFKRLAFFEYLFCISGTFFLLYKTLNILIS